MTSEDDVASWVTLALTWYESLQQWEFLVTTDHRSCRLHTPMGKTRQTYGEPVAVFCQYTARRSLKNREYNSTPGVCVWNQRSQFPSNAVPGLVSYDTQVHVGASRVPAPVPCHMKPSSTYQVLTAATVKWLCYGKLTVARTSERQVFWFEINSHFRTPFNFLRVQFNIILWYATLCLHSGLFLTDFLIKIM